MDEPDMALSIRSVNKLVKLFKLLIRKQNHIICSVHNPILINGFNEVLSLEHKKWMLGSEFINSHNIEEIS